MNRLFVYGSLQPGRSNAHVLASVEGEWEPGVVLGRLVEEGWGARLGYPALVLGEAEEEVAGFVFSSSELAAKWESLDKFEGVEYERVVVSVRLRRGGSVEAYVYVMRTSGS